MKKNIKIRVDNVKKKYNTSCPFKIAKKIGIIIIYSDLGNIKGYYRTALKNKYIVINKNLKEEDKKIVCAHELGHYFLHRKKEIYFSVQMKSDFKNLNLENEANEFMARLLCEDLPFFIKKKTCITNNILKKTIKDIKI